MVAFPHSGQEAEFERESVCGRELLGWEERERGRKARDKI